MEEGERVGFVPRGCMGVLVEIAVVAYLITRVVPREYRDLPLLGLFGAILVTATIRQVLAKEKVPSNQMETTGLFGSTKRGLEPPPADSSERLLPSAVDLECRTHEKGWQLRWLQQPPAFL